MKYLPHIIFFSALLLQCFNGKTQNNKLQLRASTLFRYGTIEDPNNFFVAGLPSQLAIGLDYIKEFESDFFIDYRFEIINSSQNYFVVEGSVRTPMKLFFELAPSPCAGALFGKKIEIKGNYLYPSFGYSLGLNFWYLFGGGNKNFEYNVAGVSYRNSATEFQVTSTLRANYAIYQRVIFNASYLIGLEKTGYIGIEPSFSLGLNKIYERKFDYVSISKSTSGTAYFSTKGTNFGISVTYGF